MAHRPGQRQWRSNHNRITYGAHHEAVFNKVVATNGADAVVLVKPFERVTILDEFKRSHKANTSKKPHVMLLNNAALSASNQNQNKPDESIEIS